MHEAASYLGIFWLWERLSEDRPESCIEIWQPQRGSLSQRATAYFSTENVFPRLPLKVKVKLNLKQSFSSLENKISRKKILFLFYASSNIFFSIIVFSPVIVTGPHLALTERFFESWQIGHSALPATRKSFQVSSLKSREAIHLNTS